MKIKKELQKEIRGERQKNKLQEKLREKYDVKENHIYVVEKNSFLLFFQRMVGSFFRISTSIVLIVLATIGLLAIIYPIPRGEIFKILLAILKEMRTFLMMVS